MSKILRISIGLFHSTVNSNGSRVTSLSAIDVSACFRFASKTICTASSRFSRASSSVAALRLGSRKLFHECVPFRDGHKNSG